MSRSLNNDFDLNPCLAHPVLHMANMPTCEQTRRQIKKMFLLKPAVFFCLFIPAAFPAYGDSYYYCHFEKDESPSMFDEIITLAEGPQGRVIHQTRHGGEEIGAYDRGSEVITVYEKRYKRNNNDGRDFYIYQLNVQQDSLAVFASFHGPITRFKESFGRPYTEANLRPYSKYAELLKYLPKPEPQHYAVVFPTNQRPPRSCDSMNFLEYIIKSAGLLMLQFISM